MQLTRTLSALFYKRFAKPYFFSRDAEQVHNQMTLMGKSLGTSFLGKALTSFAFKYTDPSLEKKIDGITFPNPIGLSAGFDYNATLN
jgi:dihydroorotate dehydrogenase